MTAEISKKCHIAHFLPFTVHISITKGNSERLLADFSKLSRQMLRLKGISVACGNTISGGNVLAAR